MLCKTIPDGHETYLRVNASKTRMFFNRKNGTNKKSISNRTGALEAGLALAAIVTVGIPAMSSMQAASAEGHIDRWKNELVRTTEAYDKANLVAYQYNYHLAPTVDKNDKANWQQFKTWWCSTGDSASSQKVKNCVVGINKDKLFNSNTFMSWYRQNEGAIIYDQVIQTPGYYKATTGPGEITKDTLKAWIMNGYNAWLQTGGKSIHVDCSLGGYCY